jgi:hypothetical protein
MTLRLALCALLLAAPAAAQAPLERVLSAVSLPLSGEGHDVAALVDNLEDGADLYLYIGLDPAKLQAGAKPTLLRKNVAWNGGMAGSRPSLEASPKGSLLIKSGNEAIGRGRWSETLTIVYRNGAALVAGVTREERDTLDPAAGGVCDINLLTGKGTRSGKKVESRPQTVPLADWSEDKLPKECRF